jgi:glutathione S-transferase
VPRLHLYYAPLTSASRVLWALEEVAATYEKTKVDLANDEQRTAAFLGLQQHGKVPVLVIDGTPVFEASAMLLYIAETLAVPKALWPSPGTAERALAMQWTVWPCIALNEALARVVRHTFVRPSDAEQHAKPAEVAQRDLAAHLGVLGRHLESRSFVLGDRFSLADVTPAQYVSMIAHFGVDLSPFASVRAWHRRCTSRPAYGRMLQA